MRKIQDIELGGKNYTVKINNRTIAMAEEQLGGKSVVKILQDGLGMQALHVLLWCGIRNFDRKIKLNDVYDIVEKETDENPETYNKLMEMIVGMVLGALGIETEEDETGNVKESTFEDN